MSTDLVHIGSQSLAQGGLGRNSKLFKLKPATLELVQKTTRQEGAEPGKFRNTATNEHYPEMKLVMLVEPQEQRAYYKKGNEFSKDSKLCFSVDNVQPHQRAKEPPALYCATCPKGDVNWETWRKDKRPENLPQCSKFWHLVVADRVTQMIYYFNIKGTSVTPFEQQMQNLARLIASMEANVNAENKQIKAAYEKALAADPKTPAPVYKPLPNIFDVTFTIYPYQIEKGGPWIVGFKSFLALRPEDRAEFGALFLDFVSRKQQGNVEPPTEEAEAEAAVSGPAAAAPASTPAPVREVSAVIDGKSVAGEVVSSKEPITI